ncbi:MAG: HDIG domain-containing protein [Anaerolineales bacterium]|nr:HDIG domain-containing protein [Anaerolineales bacterium]
MTENKKSSHSHRPIKKTTYILLLVFISMGLVLASIIAPSYLQIPSAELHAGNVASQDILAPYSFTYTSEIRTEQQRETAARAVLPIYTQTDTSIARQQLERLRAALAYINSVRADEFASLEQKILDLTALEDIHLNQDIAQSILTLSESRWQTVQQEAITVLETVMRNTIREDRLEEERRRVPASISLALPEELVVIVSELVVGFMAPNSFYSDNLTEAARQQARESIAPISHSYVAGETIIQRGRVITNVDLEALEEFGLIQTQARWQDLVSAASMVFLMTVFVVLYLHRRPVLINDLRGLTLIVVVFALFLFLGRLIAPGQEYFPYLFPLTAFSLLLTTLYGIRVALIFSFPLIILFSYNLPNSLVISLYFLISSYIGVLTLGQARRLASFFWAGAAIGISGSIVIIAFHLPDPNADWIRILILIGVAHINGVASAGLAVLVQFLLAQFLGLTTALQLIDISRPDHPLLQYILHNAPGTYQHSLQVANLAERAADQIGADSLLTRVGALYHDAGKALNPFYFIENQVPDTINPHDQLDPETSSSAIIRHVTDGLVLARKYRMPNRIMDFISEHHGTMITHYQYVKAVEAADGNDQLVDEDHFRYPGPKPRSRETAILMLADGAEASVRAKRPTDEESLHLVVKDVIDQRIASGQLADTDLTLMDLNKIANSFTRTLRGMYHPRIEYPKLEAVLDRSKSPPPQQPQGMIDNNQDALITPEQAVGTTSVETKPVNRS